MTAAARGPASVEDLLAALAREARVIEEEDRQANRRMGAFGAALLRDGDAVLTHCNAGALATVDYGTALGVIYAAVEAGKEISVYADETRPLLQGARLTAWELMQAGVPTTLICDDMAASVMAAGKVDAVVVGADRIAANGDVANKIGTMNVAILARRFLVPFYVAAPLSTVDFETASGHDIPIEERAPEEVTEPGGVRAAPVGVDVFNPAFDVTPARLVDAIITEAGVARPPLESALPALRDANDL
jgi:methylthioribose-1-phosphate isomerase